MLSMYILRQFVLCILTSHTRWPPSLLIHQLLWSKSPHTQHTNLVKRINLANELGTLQRLVVSNG